MIKKQIRFFSFYIFIIFLFNGFCNDKEELKDLQTELMKLNIDKYIGIKYTHNEKDTQYPEWDIYHYSTENCKCFLGDEFFIYVRNLSSSNLLIYMQDGGACWPNSDFCSKTIRPFEENQTIPIIQRKDNNPVRDWNVIFLSACDGGVFSGDNSVDANGDGNIDSYYWGLRNLSAGISLAKELFPNPEKILLAGSSVGFDYDVGGTTIGQWLTQLINEDPNWKDIIN